jgi:hypothetical protein
MLDADGDPLSAPVTPNVDLRGVAPLADGAFAVVGAYTNGTAAFARAYDGGGTLLWEHADTNSSEYDLADWWADDEWLVVVSVRTYQVVALDLEGEVVATFDIGPAQDVMRWIRAVPRLDGGFMSVGGEVGEEARSYLAAFDDDGALDWERVGDTTFVVHAAARVDGSHVVVADEETRVWTLDRDGAEGWSWRSPRAGTPALAIADDARAYVSIEDADESVHAIAELSPDGELLSWTEVDDPIRGTDIAWSAGRVYTMRALSGQTTATSVVECWTRRRDRLRTMDPREPRRGVALPNQVGASTLARARGRRRGVLPSMRRSVTMRWRERVIVVGVVVSAAGGCQRVPQDEGDDDGEATGEPETMRVIQGLSPPASAVQCWIPSA